MRIDWDHITEIPCSLHWQKTISKTTLLPIPT